MKVKHLVLMFAVAVAAVVAWVVLRDGGAPEAPKAKPAERSAKAKAVSTKKLSPPKVEKRTTKVGKKDKAKLLERKRGNRPRKAFVKRPAFDDLEGEDFSDAEKALAKKIGEALESDKFANVAACVAEAAASTHPEIRSRMVSALQWFGRKAMPELTSFMADSDDDVRQEALDAWLDAIQEVESPTEKRDLLAVSIKTMNDQDVVEAMINEVADLPNTYQVSILSDLIQTGNSVVREAAKEEYEFLTDEEFTTQAAAESWLQENPDDEIEVEDVIEKDAAEGVETPVAQ